MSTLTVKTLQGMSPTNLITVAAGHNFYAPGHIMQVVQSTYADQSDYANISSWTDFPGLSLSITPKYTTSKVLIRAVVHFSMNGSTTCNFKFVRNGVDIGLGTSGASGQASFRNSSPNTSWLENASGEYLDTPSTTSACTYKIQFLPYYSDARTVRFNNAWGGAGDNFKAMSTITAFEVAQ